MGKRPLKRGRDIFCKSSLFLSLPFTLIRVSRHKALFSLPNKPKDELLCGMKCKASNNSIYDQRLELQSIKQLRSLSFKKKVNTHNFGKKKILGGIICMDNLVKILICAIESLILSILRVF